MSIRTCLSALLLVCLGSWSATAQRDTTIAGRTYALVPAGTLLQQLRQSDRGVLAFQGIAVIGPLSTALTRLDTVRSTLSFTDVCFLDEVSLPQVVFRRPVRGERVTFNGGLSLLGAVFQQELVLNTCRSQKHANFKQAVFLDKVLFTGNHFDQTASFIEAEFRGPQTSFANSQFHEAAYFEQARFASPASFQDVHFEGLFSGKEAAWEADVSFAGVRFRDRTLFWQARFDRTACFDTARLGGEADFNRTVFSGPTFFRQTIFIRPVHFQEASFHDQASFAGSRFHEDADFHGAQFAVDLRLNAFFAGPLDLRQVAVPLLDLRPYAGDPGSGTADSLFSARGRLYLQDAGYDKLLVHWPHLAGCLASQDSTSLADLAPVYAALRHQFRSRGLGREAAACYVEWMERRQQALPWTAVERYALPFFGLTTGYGTDLRRLGLFALASILLCALLYRLLRLAEKDRPLSLIACLYYSFSTFLGRIPFHPPGGIRLLLLGEALVGWLAWGLFIATAVVLLIS